MFPDRDDVGDQLIALLEERYITPNRLALVRLGGEQELATPTHGLLEASLCGYRAVVQHRRNDEPGRVDVFYANPDKLHTSIGNWLTGPYRFRVNPCFGHAVIKHGEIIEWWLVFGDGKFRLTPFDSTAMARSLLYRVVRAHRFDSYSVRQFGITIAGLTAAACLSAVGGGTSVTIAKQASVTIAKQASASLSSALRTNVASDKEAVRAALSAHIGVLMAHAVNQQREFDEAVVAARAAGRPVAAAAQSGHAMIPGYCVLHEFSSVPGCFTLRYSGDGGAPFGNNQGTINFLANRLVSWWYLGPDGKRLRIVPG
jgi:hypothetical protein